MISRLIELSTQALRNGLSVAERNFLEQGDPHPSTDATHSLHSKVPRCVRLYMVFCGVTFACGLRRLTSCVLTSLSPFSHLFLTILSLRKIMSQSQYSDILQSSLYDDTESLPYLASDLPQLFTPEDSCSQRTFDPFDQDFLRPQPRLSIPSSFKRVGPDCRKIYVFYDVTMHTKWVDWWLETDCGKTSKIMWDAIHQFEARKQFYQVANSSDDQPKVMCKRCGQILEHPSSLLRPRLTNRH
jgi:hypothetical protein